MNIEKKNITITLCGISVSHLGTAIFTFALSMYVLQITNDSFAFSLNLMLGILPKVLLSPIVGNLIDRSNKKIIVVAADLFSGLLMFVLFFISKNFTITIYIIYISTFLLSVSSIFLSNGLSSSFTSIMHANRLTKINSINNVIKQIIDFGAPLFSGVLYLSVSIEFFFLFNSLSFIISSVSEIFIDFSFVEHKKNDIKNSFIQDFKEGIEYLLNHKEIYTLIIFSLFINFFFCSTSVIFPYLLKTVLGLTVKNIGLIQATSSIGGVLGGIWVGYKNLKLKQSIFSSTILISGLLFIFLSIISLKSNISLISINVISIVFAISISFTIMFVNIPIVVYFQTNIKKEFLGRVGSILTTISTAVMPLSFMLYGYLLTKTPISLLLILSGTALIIIAIIIKIHKNLKKL